MAADRYTERDVAAAVEAEIVGNEMVPGLRLPSASRIAGKYRVSLKTADRALCRLAAKGLIYRVRGSGSFVKANRAVAERLRVAFVHWAFPESAPELNYAAYTVFVEQMCELLAMHGFVFKVFAEPRDKVHADIQKAWLKYDVIVVTAGMLGFAGDFLLNTKQHVILYGDDEVNHGPWNQVVYDYRPGFEKALKYCLECGAEKFFLAGTNSVTCRRRINAIMESGAKLGVPESAFAACPFAGEFTDAVAFGGECARYCMANNLLDHVIFSTSDFISCGMTEAFTAGKIVNGVDYHLISYDNLASHLPERFDLKLNAITHPAMAHGQALIAMLENLTRNPPRDYYQTYFTPATEIVIRNPIKYSGGTNERKK